MLNFNHPQVTGHSEVDFVNWYWGIYNRSPNDLPHWLIEDQLLCLSRFFGYSIHTITSLKIAVAVYNNGKNSTILVNDTLNLSNDVVANNGWIKIFSNNDFPQNNLKCITSNGKKVNKVSVGRRTMWKMYKNGLITHYKHVLPIDYSPPINL